MPNITTKQQICSTPASKSGNGFVTLVRGNPFGARMDIGHSQIIIGRATQCDFRIDDSGVSRRHCAIWRQAGKYFVRDLGSTNRTFVNDLQVSTAEVKSGDIVSIGSCALRFIMPGTIDADWHNALVDLARLDELTSLPNRRAIMDWLEIETRRATLEKRPLALALIDLDHFKRINDGFGHVAGDELLRMVGATLRRNLRSGDLAGRLGGEEFVVVLRETSHQSALEYAERCRRAIASTTFDIKGTLVHATASIGVVSWVAEWRSPAEFFTQ